jgi:hypothetical protein
MRRSDIRFEVEENIHVLDRIKIVMRKQAFSIFNFLNDPHKLKLKESYDTIGASPLVGEFVE